MEVDRETRLPFDCKSWWELLQTVPYNDQMPLYAQAPEIKFHGEISRQIPWEENHHITEVFEADVLTLKVRGFDELREIIPSRDELIRMHSEIRARAMGMRTTAEDFILKLINLT